MCSRPGRILGRGTTWCRGGGPGHPHRVVNEPGAGRRRGQIVRLLGGQQVDDLARRGAVGGEFGLLLAQQRSELTALTVAGVAFVNAAAGVPQMPLITWANRSAV